jgi:hypothetical protein
MTDRVEDETLIATCVVCGNEYEECFDYCRLVGVRRSPSTASNAPFSGSRRCVDTANVGSSAMAWR